MLIFECRRSYNAHKQCRQNEHIICMHLLLCYRTDHTPKKQSMLISIHVFSYWCLLYEILCIVTRKPLHVYTFLVRDIKHIWNVNINIVFRIFLLTEMFSWWLEFLDIIYTRRIVKNKGKKKQISFIYYCNQKKPLFDTFKIHFLKNVIVSMQANYFW